MNPNDEHYKATVISLEQHTLEDETIDYTGVWSAINIAVDANHKGNIIIAIDGYSTVEDCERNIIDRKLQSLSCSFAYSYLKALADKAYETMFDGLNNAVKTDSQKIDTDCFSSIAKLEEHAERIQSFVMCKLPADDADSIDTYLCVAPNGKVIYQGTEKFWGTGPSLCGNKCAHAIVSWCAGDSMADEVHREVRRYMLDKLSKDEFTFVSTLPTIQTLIEVCSAGLIKN